MDNIRHLFSTEQMDGRPAPARKYRKALTEIINQLGGPDKVTPAGHQLARRLAGMIIQGDRYEAALIKGEDFDVDAYITYCNAFLRLCRDLNLLPNQVPEDALCLEDFLENTNGDTH